MPTIVFNQTLKYKLHELQKICRDLNYEVLSIVFDGDNEIL